MTNYDIFDEQYYRAQYPWVKPAIDAGIIKSGREHFEKFGQAGGLTKISRYFDEDTYVEGNPDLKPFIRTPNNPNAPFSTGLDHFIQYGYEQGRSQVSPDYDEALYLESRRDLLPFIQNGTFKSGYQHFIQFATSATVFGTSGNDILSGSGVAYVELIGVKLGLLPGNNIPWYESNGSNEFDTLIGGSSRDTFVLADVLRNSKLGDPFAPYQFYVGPGFATIRNFTQGQDTIQISPPLENILMFPINNNRDLAIQTRGYSLVENGVTITPPFDTIAVIEGGGNLSLNLLPKSGTFTSFLG
ncbi:calcium-binding protein [Microcoleus sp. MON1_C1]|uniref:calcium-binding protein n=1 Tax=Microcoleus sp. MON1_C1 TaxID=2818827 RepID=UPI002FD2FDBF